MKELYKRRDPAKIKAQRKAYYWKNRDRVLAEKRIEFRCPIKRRWFYLENRKRLLKEGRIYAHSAHGRLKAMIYNLRKKKFPNLDCDAVYARFINDPKYISKWNTWSGNNYQKRYAPSFIGSSLETLDIVPYWRVAREHAIQNPTIHLMNEAKKSKVNEVRA